MGVAYSSKKTKRSTDAKAEIFPRSMYFCQELFIKGGNTQFRTLVT